MILHNIYKTLITCLIAIGCISSSYAFTSSYYTSNSKLSTGNWVKIKVSNIGMHEISFDQLKAWGFSDPSKVCVYGYGGTALTKNTFSSSFPDDLPAQPVYYCDNKIIFYGEPDLRINLGNSESKIEVLRNMYSTSGYYFLSDVAPNASAMPSSANYNLSNILSREYHNNIIYIENELDNPGLAGTFFFDRSLLNGAQQFSFSLPKPYICSEPAIFKYSYAAKVPSYTALNVEFDHPDSLIYKENHRQVIPSSLSSQYYYTSDGDIQFYINDSTKKDYTFNVSFPTGNNASYAAIDYTYLTYRRQNNLEGEAQMRMLFLNGNQNTNFIISNSNKNIQVWNVTNPLKILPHATKYNETSNKTIGTFDKSYSYSTTGNPCLIAFDPTKTMHQVEYIGAIENQNLHGAKTPDMLIITNNLCQPYAEQVAQAHRDYQGLDVLVVNQSQIFNEYSSGTPSAMAYRRFIKMFYDRNKSKFKYLLLFGEGSWDNRGIILPKEDRLLTYQTEIVEDARSAAKAYCSDSYFGMLNDDYDPENIHNNEVHIGIGRIPAQTTLKAQAAANKIVKYLQFPPTSATFNRAIFLADEGDSYGHILQQEENIDSTLAISPSTTCTRAFSTIYFSNGKDAAEARDKITQALHKGQGFFSYAGHGGETSFTGKKLWSVNAINETKYSHAPIAMFATCDAFSFDRKDGGMAEASLYNEDGGFIAIVAACRTVYMQFNQYINRAFTCELFNANEKDLIGDVFRRARNRAATEIVDRTLGVNTLCYNLAGDPAIPLYKPNLNVTTTSINNIEVKDSSTYQISPLSKNLFVGQITDKNGNVQESFNGAITLSLYDGPNLYSSYTKDKTTYVVPYDSIITVPSDKFNPYHSNDSIEILLDENLLAEITVPVTNGKFEATLVAPVPQKSNSVNRLSYFAISDDKKNRAIGHFNLISISEYNAETAISDNSAPVIEQCYINEPSFNNGDIVGNDFMFYANIASDESGINTSDGTIGLTSTLSLDGKKSYPFVSSAITNNPDGSATIAFPVSNIEDGQHTLTLSVADNAGNRANYTISFVVINRSAQVSLNVAETPARTEATFSIKHNFLEEPFGRIVIEDNNGSTIFSKANCSFPFTWDLKDSNGILVEDGNYKAYVILNGGNQFSSSEKTQVIVVK